MDDPYVFLKKAHKMEEVGDLRAAESAYRGAIATADRLPLDQYKRDYETELAKYAASPTYESQPGVSVEDVKQAYDHLLALPFCMRLQLAGFFARHEAFPEANDVVQQAFEVGVDLLVKNDDKCHEILKRGVELRDAIRDVIGPENLIGVTEKHFKKLDLDGDGFLHEMELRSALFDLSVDSEAQELVRHLLYHYFEAEAASNDEFGIDINGISKSDIQKFQKKRNSEWRGLKPKKR